MPKREDLYFILNPSLGIIKIGIAGDVEARRIGLECGCGVPLDILRVVEGGSDLEKDLHDAFGATRLRGEWFEPTEELFALATGNACVRTFVRDNMGRVKKWRAAREEKRQARLEADREAAKVERAEIARLKAEEQRLKKEREAKRAKARETAERKRRERQAVERERLKLEEQARIAKQMGLPMTEAATIAKDRREAVAQRFRNSALLGLRRPEVIPGVDTKRHETQRAAFGGGSREN